MNSVLDLDTDTEAETNTNISSRIRDLSSFSMDTRPAFVPPRFVYEFPARKRFVVVLDRSSAMGLNNRWSLLHGQLFRFISSLPNDAEVGLVTFGATAEVVLKPTLLSGDNSCLLYTSPSPRDGLLSRMPSSA